MIKISHSKGVSSFDEFSKKETQKKEIDPSKGSYFADLISDGDKMLRSDSMKSLASLNFATDKIKMRLRSVIARNLVSGFAIPEIVEGLVEYLIDVVKEDPVQAQALGVLD